MTTEIINTSNNVKIPPPNDDLHPISCKRILCILAHVDHGKTSVADCILAMTGLVRYSGVGKVRFMDSRADEQEKGITMKTAGFSIQYNMRGVGYMFTIVDTPGHVDFSKEVLSAVKSCDGALIVVDIVEGVRAQTREAIQIALDQGLKMILLVNKFDRLVLDLKKDLRQTYELIRCLVESCNMVVAQVCQRNQLNEDEHLFRPEMDNVIICSSGDGWGVLPKDVAELYLRENAVDKLHAVRTHLFDPDYYMAHDKTVKTGAVQKNRSSLFMNLVIRPLYDVYHKIGIRMQTDADTINKIINGLNITATAEMKTAQPRAKIGALLRGFATLGDAIARVAADVVPEATLVPTVRIGRMIYDKQFYNDQANMAAIDKMMCDLGKNYPTNESIGQQTSNEPKQPCYAFLSKIISVPHSEILPEKRDRKDAAITQTEDPNDEKPTAGSLATIAVVRVYYGKLKKGDKLILLQSGYKPPVDNGNPVPGARTNKNKSLKFEIRQIYILNGRKVIKASEAGTGVICGIGFDHVPEVNGQLLRTGTIVNSDLFYPIYESPQLDPVLRVSVMPVEAKHMLLLGNALKWLKQCDSVVKVTTDENGEYVFLSSGDVHLSKIILDLKKYMNGIPLVFSKPIVKIRETVINPIATDIPSTIAALKEGIHSVEYTHYNFYLELYVADLPDVWSELVEEYRDILLQIEESSSDWGYIRKRMAMENNRSMRECFEKPYQSAQMATYVHKLKHALRVGLQKLIANEQPDCHKDDPGHRYIAFSDPDEWVNMWSVGNRNQPECCNILWNRTATYKRSIFNTIDETDHRSLIDSCIVNAFHEVTQAGPICGEPVTRCAFAITDFGIGSYDMIMSCGIPISTVAMHITNGCAIAMKRAMMKQNIRLKEPVFETDIPVASNDQIGMVINIIEKRQGKVVNYNMNYDETRYGITARIPAMNCSNVANEIRQATSGFADVFLSFCGYCDVDGNPLKKSFPLENEDDSDVIKEQRSYDLCIAVRQRKGIPVDLQVVLNAEKQRTMKRK